MHADTFGFKSNFIDFLSMEIGPLMLYVHLKLNLFGIGTCGIVSGNRQHRIIVLLRKSNPVRSRGGINLVAGLDHPEPRKIHIQLLGIVVRRGRRSRDVLKVIFAFKQNVPVLIGLWSIDVPFILIHVGAGTM